MQIMGTSSVVRGELMKICNRLVPTLYQLYCCDTTDIKEQRKHTRETVKHLLTNLNYMKVSAPSYEFFGSDMSFRMLKGYISLIQPFFQLALNFFTPDIPQDMPKVPMTASIRSLYQR